MVFEDGFCFFRFLLRASRFAAEWGGFLLFIPGCQGPSLAYLSHLCDDHQPAHLSLFDTFKTFFYHPRFFVYIHCADFFSLSPRKRCGSFHSYKCGGQIPFSCVCSAPSLSSCYSSPTFYFPSSHSEEIIVWLLIVILLDLWAKSRIRKVNRRNTLFLM